VVKTPCFRCRGKGFDPRLESEGKPEDEVEPENEGKSDEKEKPEVEGKSE